MTSQKTHGWVGRWSGFLVRWTRVWNGGIGNWWLNIRRALKPLAAGLRALPGAGKAFASTQAMWRFLQNDRMKRTTLVQPLWNYAKECLEAERPEFVAGRSRLEPTAFSQA